MSDLHLEFIHPRKMPAFFRRITPPTDPREICVLAGDIGDPYSENYDTFMKHISQNFKKTFVIAGNHEYYQSKNKKTIDETNEFLRDYMARHPNITFLNNSCEIYENTCFIGTTLWSKITRPQYEINDVYKIPDIDYIKYNRLNRLAVDFLESAVAEAETQSCVIITHHLPSNDLIDPKYKTERMRPYNQWFYCDMDDFIETHRQKIGAWIYGHTHAPCVTTLHGVPMLCNPIGYPGENPWRADIGAFYDF